MKLERIIFGVQIILMGTVCHAQAPQGFFLNEWKPKDIVNPQYADIQQTNLPVTVAITVDLHDTITKIPGYLFGDNANLWTGCMSNNKGLMKYIADRNMGVLRSPGGSISDVFFWNRNSTQKPDSVPAALMGTTATDWPWYGDKPGPYDSWTMDVDSLYRILKQVNATGMITVNYGYARYGTGKHPVAKAAHMAADWVRYDNGRTRFWEIGNEVFGNWEAGYRIDRTQNKDGQPEYISPALYGQHCCVFIDSMKAAAADIGVDIKIGVVMLDSYSSAFPTWNKTVATQAGEKADFYVVHSYFTPYNQNSDVTTILNTYIQTGDYKQYVWDEVTKAGKPKLPVALTEYNIFATGSNQAVSHANGMHAVLVTGEAMKSGYGAACRWDLANGWDNGNDHGMFSYNEPGIVNYTPHPAFYHLYYLQKHTGDVLLNSTTSGFPGVAIIPTAFNSGQMGTSLVNATRIQKIVRLNMKNFKVGERYYTYTLSGTTNVDFSRKVFVNGFGTAQEAGGPVDYATIKANSSIIDSEIRILIPPLSVVFVLIEPGSKELVINNEVTSAEKPTADEETDIYPNPAHGLFTVTNIQPGVTDIEVKDILGRSLITKKGTFDEPVETFSIDLDPGVYFIKLTGKNYKVTKKLIIE